MLDYFDANTVWLRFDFPEGYVVPNDAEVLFNVLPVTNVDVCSLMLTQAQPIAKLQQADEAFFLRILETSTTANKQGFNMTSDEIIIRDFDAQCYNNGTLYRDVRNLYNRFIDDYYAFIEYNGIKDGEVLKTLRETINLLGKSVGQQNERNHQPFGQERGTAEREVQVRQRHFRHEEHEPVSSHQHYQGELYHHHGTHRQHTTRR